jgi:hypothetical protein
LLVAVRGSRRRKEERRRFSGTRDKHKFTPLKAGVAPFSEIDTGLPRVARGPWPAEKKKEFHRLKKAF